MTPDPPQRDAAFHIYTGDDARDRFPTVERLYAEVYAEAPYHEGPDQVAEFAASWPWRVAQPGFRLVLATHAENFVGMAFGHRLTADTQWWEGAVEALPDDMTTEYEGRTFAVIELVVRAPHRRRGVARRLHAHLLADRTEERVALLSLSEAEPAQHAYAAWGYRKVGRIHPTPSMPILDALVRPLQTPSSTAGARI